MTQIELLQLVGVLLIILALMILAGTWLTIRLAGRARDVDVWLDEQAAEAEQHVRRRTHPHATMPVRAVEPPRPVSIDDTMTRPLTVPQVPTCPRLEDHAAHYFIDYVERDNGVPDMVKTPCPGVRSGPHRRRI